MEKGHQLWKISMAVWLPALVLAIVGYAVAYGISYNNAKDRQTQLIQTANQCKETLGRASQYNLIGLPLDTPIPPAPSDSTLSYLRQCANADTSIKHGFLYLPK